MPTINASAASGLVVTTYSVVILERAPGDPGNRKRKMYVREEPRAVDVPIHGS